MPLPVSPYCRESFLLVSFNPSNRNLTNRLNKGKDDLITRLVHSSYLLLENATKMGAAAKTTILRSSTPFIVYH